MDSSFSGNGMEEMRGLRGPGTQRVPFPRYVRKAGETKRWSHGQGDAALSLLPLLEVPPRAPDSLKYTL